MLVDQYGRQIKSNKPILEEVAVSSIRERYGTYPSQGLTPQRLASIFKEADQGDIQRQAELFLEMEEKDLHLGGVMQTRKLAVTGLEWEILPASESAEDKKIAEAAIEMLEYLENFEDTLLDMLDALGKGFSVQEIMWELSEGQVWIKNTEWVNQQQFTFNSFTKVLKIPRLITDASPSLGEDLLPNKFILHKYKARSGATPRGGLLRPCAYMYLFKNYGIKDWVIFNELFAVPMRVGKYKPGAGADEKDALKRAVFNLGVDAAAVISDNSIIELVESARRGDAGVLSSLPEFCDKAISKGVLGHTGSAESTAGRLGGENASEAVRHDLVESDSKAVMKTIKFQMLAPWVLFNYGPGKGVPIFKLHFETGEDLETVAKVYGILVKDAGFEGIPESHIHDRFSIPVPEKGEKTLKTAQPAAPVETIPAEPKHETTANKIALMINAGVDPTDGWIAEYLKTLMPVLRRAREGALAAIEAWLLSLSAPPDPETLAARVITELEGVVSPAATTKIITDSVGQIYAAFRAAPGVALGFGGPDVRAINFLAKLDTFYTSSYLRNADAQNIMRNFIREKYLEKGGGLFGRGNAADIAELRNLLGDKVTDLENWQIRRIVDTSVQRTRNWAAVAQMHEAGIAEIEIYEPTQECGFCQDMNGKIVSVDVAYQTIERQMDMTPEEYEDDLRATRQELNRITQATDRADWTAASGNLPPYHPGCRGMAIRRIRS